ncbi:lysylphosphatidylglycerol synthase transmembrane domain-containing protein [Natronobeatus ordinarius]|uniref:lysylphosphatidylglycerol synthase transmembrane domain-containing protein n=1 Tax=Natronobeatus ordinarius TaxID=2963433 RepID=UPI0020CBF6A2|nr:lysylphosphatidylglycerol synthase transmembrane domain-containing protein [Natronobeatus ordinarius]
MRRRAVLGFAFALVLLATLVSVVGSRDVAAELATADRRVVALGIGSGVLALTFRGLVWTQVIETVDETMSWRDTAGIYLTAMFVKYATPYGQLSTEPFVAYLVSRDAEMAYEDGFAGILSADLLNYLPYYTFGFLAIAWITTDGPLVDGVYTQVLAFAVLFVALIACSFVVLRRRSLLYRLVLGVASTLRWLTGRFTDRFEDALSRSAVTDRLDGFYDSIGTIATDRRTLATSTVYAHLGMLFLMLPVYIGAVALGYELPLAVVALVVALGKLGSVVPAPGGIGGVEAMVTVGLTTLGGLASPAALTVALLYRLCTYWLTIGLGGVCALGIVLRE